MAAHQAPLSLGFSRQEQWSGLPFPSPIILRISFHSNPKEGQNTKYPSLPENVQTTIHLTSFHMLASLCSKSFRLGFHSRWSKNFQMYKLSFKKVKEQEAKLSPFSGSWRKQEILRKMSISASLTMPKPLTVWISINCGKFLKTWGYQTTWPAS